MGAVIRRFGNGRQTMKHYKEIAPESIEENPFHLMGKRWFLITAGTEERWNTMTGGWGALGHLWGRNVALAYVRPVRHTFRFTEENPRFTLCFFPEEHRKVLQFCGSHSGRDVNKAEKTGLIPFSPSKDTVAFRQADLIMECRKLYAHFLQPGDFIDPSVNRECYPEPDHHRVYIGEIERVLSHPSG